MNLILLHEADRETGTCFRVRDTRAQHVREVLSSAVGDELRVGLLGGPRGTGVVTVVTNEDVQLDCTFDDHVVPRPTVDLILAIPRPKMLRRLLPQIAALGVDRLVLLRTWRVAKPYLTAQVLTPAVYRPLLHDGLMQARATHEPVVHVEPLFRPFVEDRAPVLFGESRRFVAHPGADRDIAALDMAPAERVALVVGPEGGLLPFEVDLLGEAGFEAISMGDRTLRVETACVALLAQLDLLRRRD